MYYYLYYCTNVLLDLSDWAISLRSHNSLGFYTSTQPNKKEQIKYTGPANITHSTIGTTDNIRTSENTKPHTVQHTKQYKNNI
jgi:hypothetical protein